MLLEGARTCACKLRMMKIFVQDGNKMFLAIGNIKNANIKAIRMAMYFIGKDLVKTSQELIQSKDKSGRVYKLKSGTVTRLHQSSAPGEAPANFSGNLRKSLGFEVRGADQLEFGSRSGAPTAGLSNKQAVAKYSKFLEEGTSKMAPRPYLKPSFEKNKGNILQHFERLLEEEFTK